MQTANHTPLQVVLKPIYAYQSLVNRGEACNFEGWVGFGTGWAGLIGHQLGLVGPLKTHGLRAKFWARLWPDSFHYKLPLGPNSKLDEGEIIFFEVILEGFDANKAKKFEKKNFFQHGEKNFPPLKYLR